MEKEISESSNALTIICNYPVWASKEQAREIERVIKQAKKDVEVILKV